MNDMPSKAARLQALFDELSKQPPAASGLEAYAQISNTLNQLEDEIFGDLWDLPRTYLNGEVTNRLYPSQPECFETIEGFPGVTAMVHTKEFIFISRYGAIEVQRDTGECEKTVHFSTRRHAVLFAKLDAYGDAVWHGKNAGPSPVPKPPGTISLKKRHSRDLLFRSSKD